MKILLLFVGLVISVNSLADVSQLKLELILAKRGDFTSQFRVATAYELGIDGVTKNLKESFSWYLKAAEQSHAPSQYKVGYFYENGFGVAKNVDTAILWYKKADANGSGEANKRLNKTAYEKKLKEQKANRLAMQNKLKVEEQKRKARAEKERNRLKQQAAKKAQLEAKKNVSSNKQTKKVVKKQEKPVKKKSTVNIPNLMQVVLSGKWKNRQGPADYLPSTTTACLESGSNELTCFSSEKNRKVKNANVTYTTKSSIVGFKANGSFDVIYHYNGIKISGTKSNSSDIYGLKTAEGWQEPSVAARCKANSRKSVTCYRGNKKVNFNL